RRARRGETAARLTNPRIHCSIAGPQPHATGTEPCTARSRSTAASTPARSAVSGYSGVGRRHSPTGHPPEILQHSLLLQPAHVSRDTPRQPAQPDARQALPQPDGHWAAAFQPRLGTNDGNRIGRRGAAHRNSPLLAPPNLTAQRNRCSDVPHSPYLRI